MLLSHGGDYCSAVLASIWSPLTLLVTGLAVAYLVWKIDLETAIDVLADADVGYFAAAATIMIVTTVAAGVAVGAAAPCQGRERPLSWLTRTRHRGVHGGTQVLPTSIGGDAVGPSRPHAGIRARAGLITGLGAARPGARRAATLTLAAVGFVVAIGDYDVGAYLWIEGALVLGTVVVGVVVFSERARGPLARFGRYSRPCASSGLSAPCTRAFIRTARTRALLAGLLAFTLVVQAVRVLPIWLVGKSVAIDLPPRPYYVMGPILFVVLLAPFTINGLAVGRRSSSASSATSASRPSRRSRRASSSSSSTIGWRFPAP